MAKSDKITKDDIEEKAEKLGIKKENLELGLKQDTKKMHEAIDKAYAFKFKGK
jgi:hypothetical protein